MLSLNGVKIEPTIFPDKTSQVWKLPDGLIKEENEIVWNFEHEGEIMHLFQLRDLIPFPCSLYMPYLPYARQDKEIANDKTFALNQFVSLINYIGFSPVSVFDAHNFQAVEHRGIFWRNIEPTKEIQAAIDACKPDVICFPDEGAGNRYKHLVMGKIMSVCATKIRDQLTGEIISTAINYDRDLNTATFLIVDDICDGGRTFIELAKLLYNRGAKEVNLYVSHGIFSKGIQVLRDAGIQRIFTKDGEVK